jgi:hypothetical protein
VGGAVGATFLYVSLAFIFFRAGDFATAGHVLAAMAGGGAGGRHAAIANAVGTSRTVEALALAGLYAWVVAMPNTVQWAERLRPTAPWALLVATLLVAAVLQLDHPTVFIYFQF